MVIQVIRSFLYSSVYSCHLFLIYSASIRSIPFLSFIVPIFAWNIPLVLLILLKRSLVFPILLFSCIFALFLKKAFLSLPMFSGTLHSNGNIFPFLLCLSLLFFSQLFVRLPLTTILPFCIYFYWGWFWSPPPVHSSSGTLSIKQIQGIRPDRQSACSPSTTLK